STQPADARSDLYSFGALIYSLEYLHHALEEKDFEHEYSPKLITDRYPDVHPTFFRLVNKTFVRDLNTRFPTDEASKLDPTGFTELITSLDVCRRSFDNVRLDIAAWTTTGMVRTGMRMPLPSCTAWNRSRTIFQNMPCCSWRTAWVATKRGKWRRR